MSDDDAELGEQLVRVARGLRRRWMVELAAHDLSPHHVRALRSVAAQDGLRLRTLADDLAIAPRSATDVVDALEARGLVAREADPVDRRATRVVATAAGRSTMAQIGAERRASLAAPFAQLGDDQRRQLSSLLALVEEGVTQSAPPGED